MKKLVFASGNKHKLSEIATKLTTKLEVISMRDLGFEDEIEEPGATLEENAEIKAKHINKLYSVDCFADDTGLEIEALNGAPGVYSARFAGEGCSFDDNVQKTLALLADKSNRKACFRTVICLIINNETHFFEGRIDGEITTERFGTDGFGYDPIFRPDGFEKTFAEMSQSEKNQISHRALAVDKLVQFFTSNLGV
jgi:XTP/dITP diphosphohydrolase